MVERGMPMREFEPIFDLKSRKVIGYEVLYRGVEDREKFFSSCTEQQDLEIFLGHVEEIRRVREIWYNISHGGIS